ncbi:MAG TPA: hypothetical protein VFX56_07050 [Nitrospira sp.]|nr:hypothetical protein [Nitrospira sp.]
MPRTNQTIRRLIVRKKLEPSRVGFSNDLRCHSRCVSWAQPVNVR